MFGESVFRFEFHSALFANVFHFVELGVCVEILLAFESFLADLTLEFLDLGFVFVMLMEIE